MKADKSLMVLIPSGAFQMGISESEVGRLLKVGQGRRRPLKASDLAAEMPQHCVVLDAFYMDVHKVTLEQYTRFLQDSGHRVLPGWVSEFGLTLGCAVVGVSWHDANAYCAWVGKRLPTEAEWEKAARGTLAGLRHSCGNALGPIVPGSPPSSCPAEERAPNRYGVHDMVDNVWEWCADWYDPAYYAVSPSDNPGGPGTGSYRVVRGGTRNMALLNARAARRKAYQPESRSLRLGFRCVKDVSVSHTGELGLSMTYAREPYPMFQQQGSDFDLRYCDWVAGF